MTSLEPLLGQEDVHVTEKLVPIFLRKTTHVRHVPIKDGRPGCRRGPLANASAAKAFPSEQRAGLREGKAMRRKRIVPQTLRVLGAALAAPARFTIHAVIVEGAHREAFREDLGPGRP